MVGLGVRPLGKPKTRGLEPACFIEVAIFWATNSPTESESFNLIIGTEALVTYLG
jgi:hypothetical protein